MADESYIHYKIDPGVLELDDPRIPELSSCRLAKERIMELIQPQDPFELRNGMLVMVSDAELDNRIREYRAHAVMHIRKTGGVDPHQLWRHKDTLASVFPELKEKIETVDKELGSAQCASCAFTRRVLPLLTTEMFSIKPDGRDLSPLEGIVNPLTMRKLKGMEVEVDEKSIPLPPHLVKKKIPRRPEFRLHEKFTTRCVRCGQERLNFILSSGGALMVECPKCLNTHMMPFTINKTVETR